MRTQAWFALCSLAAACALLSNGTWAQPAQEPSAQDKALSEQLFRDAKKLLDAGQIPEACAKFAESHRLEAKLGTLLNLAACHEKEGKTASAWAEFQEGLRIAKKQGEQDRVDFAQEKIGELEKRLSRVAIEITETVAGMEIKLNDKSLSAAAAGSDIPLDPGEYSIVVTAPGKKDYETKLTLEEGPVTKSLVIPKLEDGESTSSNSNSTGKESEPFITPKFLRTTSYVMGGIGIAGIGLGALFGGLTLSNASTADENCILSGCNKTGAEANDRAHSYATVSNIGFTVGLIGLGAGIALFILSSPSKKADGNAHVWIAPSVGLSGSSLTAGGRF